MDYLLQSAGMGYPTLAINVGIPALKECERITLVTDLSKKLNSFPVSNKPLDLVLKGKDLDALGGNMLLSCLKA